MRPFSLAQSPVPTFYLYGEPQRIVTEGFVHVESLDDRSCPSEWTICPHIHRDLNHMILIAEGGGSMQAEADVVHFTAPCLLLIPAGVIHGFAWHQESRGWVTTVADTYLHQLLDRDGELGSLFRGARVVPLSENDRAQADNDVRLMMMELSWTSPGQRAAVEAALLSLMVVTLRRMSAASATIHRNGKCAILVARLRERIDWHFRDRMQVAQHARALGVSEGRLRQACARIAAVSPASMQDERTLLEARWLLLYSNLGVAEIAYSVGFEDPAYFSRFFTRHVGQPPGRYRAEKGRQVSML